MFRARKKTPLTHILLILCYLLSPSAHAESWQQIAPGLEYLDYKPQPLSQWSHIHAFQIDPARYQLGLVMAKDLPKHYASAQAFQEYSNALIAVNGGFFSPKKEPLGLRINNHKLLNPVKYISWWGVFSIKNHTASISSPRNFHRNSAIDFAIQTGPRLLISGEIPSLKPGFANRSALGITAKGKVILMVTENLPMTTTDLAKTLKNSPYHCVDALNLDGGSSTQLYAKMDHFSLDVPGFSQVSDAIIVKPRS